MISTYLNWVLSLLEIRPTLGEALNRLRPGNGSLFLSSIPSFLKSFFKNSRNFFLNKNSDRWRHCRSFSETHDDELSEDIFGGKCFPLESLSSNPKNNDKEYPPFKGDLPNKFYFIFEVKKTTTGFNVLIVFYKICKAKLATGGN